jgi:hypothetical protein
MAKKRRLGILTTDNQGDCLYRYEKEFRVASAYGAFTERQARLYASNGGNAESVQLLQKAGQPYSYKYFRDYYFVVETRVLRYLWHQARINWDAASVRLEMYQKFGDEILDDLCTTFFPPASTLEEMEEEARREHEALERTVGKKDKPQPPAKPYKPRKYRVVDLDEFYHRRHIEELSAEQTGNGNVFIHDGQLFKSATMTASFTTGSWQRAIDAFRYRLGGSSFYLPFARYIALSVFEWSKAIRLRRFPTPLTRESLREAIRAVPAEKKSVFEDKDWWLKYESGCDWDEPGQKCLVPMLYDDYMDAKEVCKFSPRERRVKRASLVELTPAMRKWRPKRQKVKRMKQLVLKFPEGGISPRTLRMMDRRRPNQYLLFAC